MWFKGLESHQVVFPHASTKRLQCHEHTLSGSGLSSIETSVMGTSTLTISRAACIHSRGCEVTCGAGPLESSEMMKFLVEDN